MLDARFTRALHVEALRHSSMHAESDPSVLFQASTIGALLDGAYDGDVSFAELAEHGDLGLGTLNGLDGEMIAVDGRFYRADVNGEVNEIDPGERTPFAVVVPFAERRSESIGAPMTAAELTARLDSGRPGTEGASAIRIDGGFSFVRARSVPRQVPPYRPLTEVVADQHVFDLADVTGTVLGFRFPDHSDGIEVDGYHLHFIAADRSRGGHVIDFRCVHGRFAVDPVTDLHVELPPGVDLDGHHLDDRRAEELRRIEG
jgi:acetolactate decarboxylase